MAQSGSAQQREPSMEEILASIRKIIEDTDQSKIEAENQGSEPVLNNASEPGEPDISAFREAIAELGEKEAASTHEDRPSTFQDDVVDAAPEATDMVLDVSQKSEDDQSNHQPDDAALTSDVSDMALQLDEIMERASSEDASVSGGSSLLSPHAGRQVAGAFDELKEAFVASKQKSFDDMAEEMLRPMLQDWLDNNLPVLVERLVREEIERIARG